MKINDGMTHTIHENVLLTKVEQIEHPPPSSLSSTKNKVLQQKMTDLEYVYDSDEECILFEKLNRCLDVPRKKVGDAFPISRYF